MIMKKMCAMIMLAALFYLTAGAQDGARGAERRVSGRWAESPLWLTANNMSVAMGQPSLVLMSSGSVQIPVWSLSGGTVGQSVAGLVTGLPSGCAAVKVEIVVTTTDAATSPTYEDVYRVHLSEMVEDAPFTARYYQGNPVRTALPAGPFHSRTIVLESYYEVVPNAPLWVRHRDRIPTNNIWIMGRRTSRRATAISPPASSAPKT
jgi:hypothetical protein